MTLTQVVMQPLFLQSIQEHTKPVNDVVLEGYATYALKNGLAYYEQAARSIAREFPPGLEYLGLSYCTPEETYNVASKLRDGKRTLDIATSTLRMIKHHFRYKGQDFRPIYQWVPYSPRYNLCMIGGTQYKLSPILSDRVVSPGPDQVFLRLIKDRITVKRIWHTVLVNGQLDNLHVPYAVIYRPQSKGNRVPPTTGASTSLVHYLFGKYGVTQVFEQYLKIKPVYGTTDTIVADKYPASDWVIISSHGTQPKTCLDRHYLPSNVTLALPVSHWNPTAKLLVASLFYLVDHFPMKFRSTVKNTDDLYDKPILYRLMLGEIVKSGALPAQRLLEDIDHHYTNLDHHVDSYVLAQLRSINVHVRDFYDLLIYTALNFSALLLEGQESSSSMHGKVLEVVYNTYFVLTKAFASATFSLNRLSRRRKDRDLSGSSLTPELIQVELARAISLGRIFDLRKNSNVAEPVNFSCDHPYWKATSAICPQESIPGQKPGSPSERHHIPASAVVSGCPLYLSKNQPDPAARANPWIQVSQDGVIECPDEYKEVVKRLANDMRSH